MAAPLAFSPFPAFTKKSTDVHLQECSLLDGQVQVCRF